LSGGAASSESHGREHSDAALDRPVPPCPVSDGVPAMPDVDDELRTDEADIDLDGELDA